MRPYGTSKQLHKRRERALRLLKRGKSVVQVAAQLGVTRCSVYRWCQKETTKQKSERAPGKPAYLSNEHIKQLEQELLRGAYAHEYSEDYWTLDRIAHLIWDLRFRHIPWLARPSITVLLRLSLCLTPTVDAPAGNANLSRNLRNRLALF